MYNGLYDEHIKSVSVYDGSERIEIPRDEITFEEESLFFKHWTRLKLEDFPFVSADSKLIEIAAIDCRVLNLVTVVFDFDADPEESRGNWVYDVEIDPLEVKVLACSDYKVMDLYKDDLEGMILDEMLHSLDIEQEDLDVDIV